MSSVSAMRIWGLVAIGGMLIACKPSLPFSPSGQITLTYSSASKTAAFFVLENHTAQSIAVRGEHTFWSGTIPWDTAMVCTSANSLIEEETPMALSDGFPKIINVAPGDLLQLRIEGENVGFAAQHKGGVCHLRLRLQTGIVIESIEFRP